MIQTLIDPTTIDLTTIDLNNKGEQCLCKVTTLSKVADDDFHPWSRTHMIQTTFDLNHKWPKQQLTQAIRENSVSAKRPPSPKWQNDDFQPWSKPQIIQTTIDLNHKGE